MCAFINTGWLNLCVCERDNTGSGGKKLFVVHVYQTLMVDWLQIHSHNYVLTLYNDWTTILLSVATCSELSCSPSFSSSCKSKPGGLKQYKIEKVCVCVCVRGGWKKMDEKKWKRREGKREEKIFHQMSEKLMITLQLPPAISPKTTDCPAAPTLHSKNRERRRKMKSSFMLYLNKIFNTSCSGGSIEW